MTEAVFGLNTGRDDAARIMNRFIRNDWQSVEAALYRGKWFDYRFMNPVQATFLYASEYIKAYRQAYSTSINSEKAEFITPLKLETLFELPEDDGTKGTARKINAKKRKISGIWRGRMVADAMSMPYGVYLELAFHWSLRYWQQNNLPRPQQLYSDLVVDRATIDWEARQQSEFYYSTLPQYKNGAYIEAMSMIDQNNRLKDTILESQNAHHEWLLGQCKDRSNGHALLAQMVFHDQVLPIDKVRDRLDDHGFERFLSFAESEPVIVRYN